MSSFPAAILPAVQQMNPMNVLLSGINTNPYFIGLMMLLLNIGGRFLSLEITKGQEKFLSKPYVRRFLLFAVIFVGTRNILISACLTAIMILVIGYLFNENSELCIWKSCSTKKEESAPAADYTGLTAEEAMILRRLQDKNMVKSKQVEPVEKKVESASYYYSRGLTMINTML